MYMMFAQKRIGGSGYQSQYILHAKQALGANSLLWQCTGCKFSSDQLIVYPEVFVSSKLQNRYFFNQMLKIDF